MHLYILLWIGQIQGNPQTACLPVSRPHGSRKISVLWVHLFFLGKLLQDDDNLPKWKSCSWLGDYAGHSRIHAGNIHISKLLGTVWKQSKGCIIWPIEDLSRSKMPTSQVAVIRDIQYSELCDSVLSRTGYIMTFLWLSNHLLQQPAKWSCSVCNRECILLSTLYHNAWLTTFIKNPYFSLFTLLSKGVFLFFLDFCLILFITWGRYSTSTFFYIRIWIKWCNFTDFDNHSLFKENRIKYFNHSFVLSQPVL
jgi:hypothetical protein